MLGAQSLTQTIRGTILDTEAKYPLTGVTVKFKHLEQQLVKGATTDLDGTFTLSDLPLGRATIQFSYLGYETVTQAIDLTSAKELVLTINMIEAVTDLATVEVRAVAGRGQVRNEMATVSARSFSVEETDKYAGSRGEPTRMAANFAGVQGSDDSRNDIVIRGNNPNGVGRVNEISTSERQFIMHVNRHKLTPTGVITYI
jgi:hypothetical protein